MITSIRNTCILLSVCMAAVVQAQVQPHEPPTTALRQGEPNLLLTTDHLSEPVYSDLFSSVEPRQVNQELSYQLVIQNGSGEPVQVKLQTDNWPVGARLYVRSISSGAYHGPYRAEHHAVDGIITSNPVFDPEFVIELITTQSEDPASEPGLIAFQSIPAGHEHLDPSEPALMDESSLRDRPVILLTGYWPPTNEMIRHFSPQAELNPMGWQGENWENRGYDVVSYFPTFTPPDCDNCGAGSGDIMVDYQDTSLDFWPIADGHAPIAVITFSRGAIDYSWEMEYNYFNRTNWYPDYIAPTLPTPNPPETDQAAYYQRFSTLPMRDIESAINDSDLGLNGWIDWDGDPGHFVSEFMGYHGVWYKALQDTLTPCYTAGHVHVGGLIDWDTARLAAEETVRVVLDYLDQFFYTPGDVNNDEELTVQDLVLIVNIILGTMEPSGSELFAADVNQDGSVNIQDVILFVTILLN